MKSLPLSVPALFISIVFAAVIIYIFRISVFKNQRFLVSVTSYNASAEAAAPAAPVSELPYLNDEVEDAIPGYPGLADFAAPLLNGQSGMVVGVYATDVFALPVNQQPANQPDYVSHEQNAITQFGLPKKFGSTGLLAHNYLSGSRFTRLKNKQDVILIYGDGQIEHYIVSYSESFRALKPESPFSTFINNSDPQNQVLTSAELFNQVYTTRHQLVFQTCIEEEGNPSWGRLFVIATLAEPIQINITPSTSPVAFLN